MIDDFARLRADIYLQYEPTDANGLIQLSRAVAGTPAGLPLDPVLDGLCRLHASSRSTRPGSTDHPDIPLGLSSYTDRALADLARAGCPGPAGEIDAIPPQSLLRYGLSAGKAVVSPDEIRHLLRMREQPSLVVDACAYAAVMAITDVHEELDRVAGTPGPWGVRLEAALALHALGCPVPPDLASVVLELEGIAPGSAAGSAATHGAACVLAPTAATARVDGDPSVLAQTVFYGDPLRLGRGGSGGLGALVHEIGGALAAGGIPVLTMVCYDTAHPDYPLEVYRPIAPGHLLVRMPVYLSERSPLGFLESEHRIARAVERALDAVRRAGGGVIGAVHVRFLDDASRAVARVVRSRGIPLVVTLTPDPHRTICTADGVLAPRDVRAAREVVNRVLIGDELLHWAKGVVAIGRESFSRELVHYFPKLENTGGRILAGIDEGVNTAEAPPIDGAALICDPNRPGGLALAPSQLDRPILISVGRLSAVKGQVSLVRAWAEGPLHQRYNLVIVGGDLEAPSSEERSIAEAIRQQQRPELVGRLCHLGAQDNAVIRSLLGWCSGRRSPGGLDLYVCPSLKEEFGLSILEAMAAGLPVLAPLRGGPRTYIRHGVNGFLFDTRDAHSIQIELETLLGSALPGGDSLIELKRRARETVRSHYSLNSMADEYARCYQRVMNLETVLAAGHTNYSGERNDYGNRYNA